MRPSSHGSGSAKPYQKAASAGSRARASTPPDFEPFHTSHAAQAAASVTIRNPVRSRRTLPSSNGTAHGPPYMVKTSRNDGSLPF